MIPANPHRFFSIAVETEPSIKDSVCVSYLSKRTKDEKVVLFVKMADKNEFTQELNAKLKAMIRSALSARHVPSLIVPVQDIPVSIIAAPVSNEHSKRSFYV